MGEFQLPFWGRCVFFLSSEDACLLPQGSVHRSLCSSEECIRAEECILTAKYKPKLIIQKQNKLFWLGKVRVASVHLP